MRTTKGEKYELLINNNVIKLKTKLISIITNDKTSWKLKRGSKKGDKITHNYVNDKKKQKRKTCEIKIANN